MMKTKGDYVPSKHKQIESNDNTFVDQYNNLNLNQNRQHLFEENIWSKSVTTDKRKVQNLDYNDLREKENSTLWKKSNKHLSSSLMNLDYGFDKKDKFKKKENSITNISTLALHIACYENTMEAEADSETAGKEDLKGSKKGLIKKWDISKQFLSGLSSSNIQNPFEFPRQQENEEVRQPEVAQFKASQKLLNPNKLHRKNQRKQQRELNRKLRDEAESASASEGPKNRRRKTQKPLPKPVENEETKTYRQKLRFCVAGDTEDSEVNTAREYFEPILSANYDRILLYNEARKIEELFLNQQQIDKIFESLQRSSKNPRILYLSLAQIHSDTVLPSLLNVDIILTPFPGSNGNYVLAAFNLTTRIPWRFFMAPNHRYPLYKRTKDALEMKLKARLGSDFKFQSDKPPRDCARLVVQRTDSYNDGILVCRAAEDIYFTGWVMFWDPFDVNVERERYQRIFDTLNNDWDGVWPERCDGVSSSLDESDNDSETPSDNTNVDGDASSNLDTSSQASDVDEDAPIPINSDPLIDFDDRHSLPPFDHNPQLGSSQRLSPNTSAPFPVNDANDGVAEENSAAPSNNGSNSTDRELAGIIRMANLGDPCSVSSLSNSSNQVIPPPPVQQTPVLIEQNWDIKFVPKRQFWETECSSLSGFEDEEDAASDPPNAVEIDSRDYPEVETSEEEEPFDRDEYYLREQKCLSIDVNIKNFWKCVRKAAEERDGFIKKLQNQLLKERCYSVDEMKCLNSKVQLIEGDLNRIIPVAPKFRVSYEAGSNKNTVIHKGYAYKREGNSNVFRCTFIYKFNPCHSYIFVNEDDCLIERSLCDHYHIGFEEFTEDEPPPVATPVSLPRIVHNIPAKNGKFTKMMKFLNELLVEICDWRCQIELSMENVKIVYQYISELEANGDDLLMSRRKGICSKMVVMDAKNLMKCIRFDKLDAEKLA